MSFFVSNQWHFRLCARHLGGPQAYKLLSTSLETPKWLAVTTSSWHRPWIFLNTGFIHDVRVAIWSYSESSHMGKHISNLGYILTIRELFLYRTALVYLLSYLILSIHNPHRSETVFSYFYPTAPRKTFCVNYSLSLYNELSRSSNSLDLYHKPCT